MTKRQTAWAFAVVLAAARCSSESGASADTTVATGPSGQSTGGAGAGPAKNCVPRCSVVAILCSQDTALCEVNCPSMRESQLVCLEQEKSCDSEVLGDCVREGNTNGGTDGGGTDGPPGTDGTDGTDGAGTDGTGPGTDGTGPGTDGTGPGTDGTGPGTDGTASGGGTEGVPTGPTDGVDPTDDIGGTGDGCVGQTAGCLYDEFRSSGCAETTPSHPYYFACCGTTPTPPQDCVPPAIPGDGYCCTAK